MVGTFRYSETLSGSLRDPDFLEGDFSQDQFAVGPSKVRNNS